MPTSSELLSRLVKKTVYSTQLASQQPCGPGGRITANSDIQALIVKSGELVLTPAEQAAIIAANTCPVIPVPISGAAIITGVVTGDSTATVSWTLPVSAGLTLIGCSVTLTPATSSGSSTFPFPGSATSGQLTGLTNGIVYTCTVSVTSSTGESVTSLPSTSFTPSSIPSVPTNVSASAGDTTVTLSWEAPASNGGAPLSQYRITPSVGSIVYASSSSTSYTFSSLTNGTTYTFSIEAQNKNGFSQSVSTNPVTPAGMPGSFSITTFTPGNEQFTLSWSSPSPNGSPIQYYTIMPSNGKPSFDVSGSITTATVSGLTNGTSYTCDVIAVNSKGSRKASTNRSIIPANLPPIPRIKSVQRGDTTVIVKWNYVPNNGSAIQYFTITSSPGGIKATTNGYTEEAIVGSLTNGVSYTFTVTATNSVGTTNPSDPSDSVTPAAIPSAPTAVSSARGASGQAVVSFSPPASDGGDPITEYIVRASSGGFIGTGTSSPITLSGLSNGSAYTFTVTAKNSVGTSVPSSSSAPIVPATLPSAPSSVTCARGASGQAVVSFSTPASNGGDPITEYTVTSSPDGFTGIGVSSPITLSGLSNGQAYTFTVTSRNSVGTSDPSSSSASITPATVPSAPTAVSSARGASGEAVVSFSTPASNGDPITEYTVTSSPGGVKGVGSSSPITLTRLTNGETYTFTVTAKNGVGISAPSSSSAPIVPATVPSAPTAVSTARGASGEAVVSFSTPASNGDPITEYTVTSSPGGVKGVGSSSPITISRLSNGQAYTFTVTAKNGVGTSAPSSSSASIVPATVPSAPTGVSCVRGGSGQAVVSFSLPDSNGLSITSYTVTSSPGGLTGTGTSSPITVSGLSNGESYTFTVTAQNGVGTSAPSSSSASITPATVPSAPIGVTCALGESGQAIVSWNTPVNEGGLSITGYTITPSPLDVAAVSVGPSLRTTTISGLTNGKQYTFTLLATNAIGTSPTVTTAAFTPGSKPGAASITSATRGNGQVTLSWSAPSTNGYPIQTYTITPTASSGTSPAARSVVGSILTVVFPGLTNGVSYTFNITSINSIGSTVSAESSPVTPATFPSAPTSVSGVRGDSSVEVSWIAAASNGSPITQYLVTSSPGNFTARLYSTTDIFGTTAIGTSATVSGLTNGTEYTFTVAAINDVGSTTSLPSLAVTPASFPGAPTAVTGVRADGSVTVSWTVPTSDGGSPITGYRVDPYAAGALVTPSRSVAVVGASTKTISVPQLTNGTAYTFVVCAINSIGETPSSASAAVTPARTPDAPTGVTGVRGNGSVAVSWSAPASNGGDVITGYTLTSTPRPLTGSPTVSAAASATSATFPGLTNGTSYTFVVTATNSVGSTNSSASAAVIPARTPDAPTGVTGVRGDSSVAVSWSAPASNGGDPLTEYTITSTPGGFTASAAASASSVSFPGLSNGTPYTFVVTATNTVGSTNSSASVAVTPARAPDAPTGVTGVRADSSVAVSWSAPASNGGDPLTGYTITSTPQPLTGSATVSAAASATSATFPGLTNGTSYTFLVTARNAVGSTSSTASAAVIPARAPDAPTISQTPVSGNTSIDLTWNAPLYNGGSALTGYTVEVYDSTSSTVPVQTIDSISPTTTSQRIQSLVNGTSYTCKVRATNAAGSTLSGSSVSVTPATVPSIPKNGAGIGGKNGIAPLSWSAPDSSGGSILLSYKVNVYDSSGTFIKTQQTADGSALTLTITGLTNATTYQFGLIARNAVGDSLESALFSVTPAAGVPDTPSGLSGTTSKSSILFSWTTPASNGSPITDYRLKLYNADGSSLLTDASGFTAVSYTATGLSNGVTYKASILAKNVTGYSTESAKITITLPVVEPELASITSLTPGKRSITVVWAAPSSDGGAPITSYTIGLNGSTTYPVSQLTTPYTKTLTGLIYGATYTLTLTATNGSNLTSVVTSASFTPTATVPGVVTGISGTVSKGSVALTWVAPADDGGAAITSYTVTSADGGTLVYPSDRTQVGATISGLTNGTTHAFTVIGTNVLGSSSSVSYTATFPVVAPEPSTGLIVTAGQRYLGVQWTAPSNTGGVTATITGYTVVCKTPAGATVGTVDYPQGVTGTSATVTGLTYGTTYTLTVTATNSSSLTSSASTTGTPSAIAPADPAFSKTVTVRGYGSITVTWGTPVDVFESTIVDGGAALASYVVSCSPAPDAPNPSSYTIDGLASTTTSTFSKTFSGLTPGTRYTFSCVAKNAAALSSPGGQSYQVTAIGAPSVPTAVYGLSGMGQVTVNWTGSTSDSSSPIKSYTVTPSPAPPTGISTSKTTTDNKTSLVYAGLTNGTAYTFTVRATNKDLLDSAESTASSAIKPVTNPGTPTSVTCSPSNKKVILQWDAPIDTGGADILNYTVTCSDRTTNSTAEGTGAKTMTYSGLTNGTAYTFTITATNKYTDNSGNVISYTSVLPAQTASITPAPDYPAMPILETTTTTVLHTAAIIRWKAPIDDGGATITNYKVWYTTATSFTTVSASDAHLSGTGFKSLDDATGNFTANKDASGVFSYKVTGLTNGSAYKFKVTAKNSSNLLDSFPSKDQAIVTPAIQPPDALAAPSLTTTLKKITVTWAGYNTSGYIVPNTNGATINDYTITYSYTDPLTGNAASGSVTATSSTSTIDGLTYGVTYAITVKANYTIGGTSGSSPASSSTSIQVTPVVPTTPVFVSNTPGKRQITVTWKPPFDGGRTITSYTLRCLDQTTSNDAIGKVLDASGNRVNGTAVSPYTLSDPSGNFTANKDTSGNLSYTFTNLTYSTTYKFTILATNSVGPSIVSAEYPGTAVQTAVTVPSAVRNLTIVNRYKAFYLTWEPPTDDGGADTLYYFISISDTSTSKYSPLTLDTDANGTNPYIYSPTQGYMYAFNTGTQQLVRPNDSMDCYNAGAITSTLTSGKIALNDTAKKLYFRITSNNIYISYTFTSTSTTTIVYVYASTKDSVTSAYTEVSAASTTPITNSSLLNPDPPLVNYFTTPNYVIYNYTPTTQAYAIVKFEYPYYSSSYLTPILSFINTLYISTDDGATYRRIGSFTGASTSSSGIDTMTNINYQMTAATKFITTNAITYSTVTYTIYFNTPTQPLSTVGRGPIKSSENDLSSYSTIYLYPGTEYSYYATASYNTTKTAGGITGQGSKKVLIGKFRVNGLPEPPSFTSISVTKVAAATPKNQNTPGATLAWAPPTYQGDVSGVTSYTVSMYKGTALSAATAANKITPTITYPTDRTTCSATIAGLDYGTNYIFGISATNAYGSSTETIYSTGPAFVTESTNPDPPSNFTGTYVSPGTSINLSWTAPTFTGASSISGYTIYKDGVMLSIILLGTDRSVTVSTGLTVGTKYTFAIECVNNRNVVSTRASITPINYPGQPKITSATPVAAAIPNSSNLPGATVAWTAVGDGGDPSGVTYTINVYTGYSDSDATQANKITPGGITYTLSSTSCSALVSGLQYSTRYVFGIIATNKAGSTSEKIYPPFTVPTTLPLQTLAGIPNPPTNLTATITEGTGINLNLTLSWDAPSFWGGTAFRYYIYINNMDYGYQTASSNISSSSTTRIIQAGTTDTYSIQSSNGSSQGSDITLCSITPINYPSYIQFNTTTLNAGNIVEQIFPSVTLTWNVPSSGDPSGILSYTLRIVYTYNSIVNTVYLTINSNADSTTSVKDDPSNLSLSISTNTDTNVVTGTLSGLYFGKITYTVAITSTNSKYTNKYYNTFTITTSDVLPPIINIIYISGSYRSNRTAIDLSWPVYSLSVYPTPSTMYTFLKYTYQIYYGTTDPPNTIFSTISNSTSATITGLTAGVKYYFAILTRGYISTTSYKESTLSSSYSPVNYPATPSSGTVISTQQSNFCIRFTTPAAGGATNGITKYTILLYSGTTAAIAQGASATVQTIELTGTSIDTTTTAGSTILTIPSTNLSVGTLYTYSMYCNNGTYDSSTTTRTTSAVACTPAPPDIPVLSLQTNGACSITVQWTQPNLNGNTFVSYGIQYKLTSATSWTSASITTTTYTINTTANTSYDVQIKTNATYSGTANSSSFSSTFTITSSTTGNPGEITSLTSGNTSTTPGAITFTWAAPTCTGGSAIASYTVTPHTLSGTTYTPGTATNPTTTTATFTNLVSGTNYYFSIRSKNASNLFSLINAVIPTALKPYEPIRFTGGTFKYDSTAEPAALGRFVKFVITNLSMTSTVSFTTVVINAWFQDFSGTTKGTYSWGPMTASNGINTTTNTVNLGIRWASNESLSTLTNYNFYMSITGTNTTGTFTSTPVLYSIPFIANTREPSTVIFYNIV